MDENGDCKVMKKSGCSKLLSYGRQCAAFGCFNRSYAFEDGKRVPTGIRFFLNFLKNPVKRQCGATRSKGKMVRTALESTNQQEFVKNTSNLLRFTGRQEVHVGV